MPVGIKHDQEKNRWDLVPWEALNEIVRVFTFGAKTYGEGNWKHVTNKHNRYFSAAMRHMIAWRNGEILDPQTGRHHLAHAAVNLIFLIWTDKRTGRIK